MKIIQCAACRDRFSDGAGYIAHLCQPDPATQAEWAEALDAELDEILSDIADLEALFAEDDDPVFGPDEDRPSRFRDFVESAAMVSAAGLLFVLLGYDRIVAGVRKLRS